VRIPVTSCPAAVSSPTVAASASGWMSAATIFMPSVANRIAKAFPIPLPAPVMTATRPAN
jgi:dihydrodipicolinate synthase/N-acetylneuraminate lyase